MKNKLLIFFLLVASICEAQTYTLYMIDKNGSIPADSFFLKSGVTDSIYKKASSQYIAQKRPRYFYNLQSGGGISWGVITGTLSSQEDLQTALAGKQASGSYAVTTNNLSDLSNAATARTNLGLGTLATQSGTFSGTSSGTNTGDQTTISGNANTATTLQTARNINGVSFNGSADINADAVINAYAAGGSPWLAETLLFPLVYCNTSTALVDNTVRYVPLYLAKAATLTGIRVYVRTQGSYTGDNNNRVGLYSYSGGTMTLVASSANSATLWTSAANAFQTIAFSSTYSAAAGLYFVGLLYNNSAQTTAPTLAGGTAFNNAAMVTFQGSNSIKYFGTVGTMNDLPSSQTMSGVTGSTASYWVAFY